MEMKEKQNRQEGSLFQSIVTCVHLFFIVIFVFTCEVFVWITFAWWNRSLHTRYQTKLQSLFVHLSEKTVSNPEIVVTGDPVDQGDTAIILCNHQIDVDWWYVWAFAKKYNKHGNLKIALKKELFYIPIFGWGIYLFDFLFLSRKWEKDEMVLKQKVKAWCADGKPFWYLIFPEGTTIQAVALKKSQQFAKEQNRPHFDLLLLPRTKGLQSSLETLGPRVNTVYDLTMGYEGYSGEIPSLEQMYTRNIDKDIPSFRTLISGVAPEKVHFHVTKYNAKEALESEDFTAWIDNVFVKKQELLRYFIKHQCFPPSN